MAVVLAIDDHPDSLEVLLLILRHLGHHALAADTGEAGRAILASEKPGLIIVDGMMPGMKGTEFIRLCRADPPTATVPIILYTANTSFQFANDAMENGANEVWIKGQVGIKQIQERLMHHLKQGAAERIAY